MALEKLSKDQVRAVVNTLGTEKVHGRHVECICKRGGGSFHGKIHLIDGEMHLEPKIIRIVHEEMKREGFTRKPKVDGPCVWNTKPDTKKESAKSKATPHLHLLRKHIRETDQGGFANAM